MLLEDEIRAKIEALYKSVPLIHMNVSLKKPRLALENAEARIVGVYAHIFRIEESSLGRPRCHSLQYGDVLCGQIEILELQA